MVAVLRVPRVVMRVVLAMMAARVAMGEGE